MTVGRWLVRLVSIVSIGVAASIAIVDVARGSPSGGFHVLYVVIAVVFVVVGWLITERKPGNAVGPLLVAFGALFACYLPADVYLQLPGAPAGAEFAALFVSYLDAPMFILIALVLILFPDGQVPSPRWRWTLGAGLLGIVLVVAGQTLQAGPFRLFPRLRNPFGIDGLPAEALVVVAYLIMLLLLVLAAVALVVRWRRGASVERTQIKWVVAAAGVLLITEIVNVVTFQADQMNAVTTAAASIGIALVPMAIGVAILRYRLYEIDRIISRSIGYAVVTGILAVVFVGAILLLQGALAPFTQGQTVAVAASTLAVFALFQPVRRRVQRAVDRRFDRTRYDAERTAAAFSERLRNETDMAVVTVDLAKTAERAVAPASLAIWLRLGDR